MVWCSSVYRDASHPNNGPNVLPQLPQHCYDPRSRFVFWPRCRPHWCSELWHSLKCRRASHAELLAARVTTCDVLLRSLADVFIHHCLLSGAARHPVYDTRRCEAHVTARSRLLAGRPALPSARHTSAGAAVADTAGAHQWRSHSNDNLLSMTTMYDVQTNLSRKRHRLHQ